MNDDVNVFVFRVPATCKDCGHEWLASFPAGTDRERLECSKCGAQNSRTAPPTEAIIDQSETPETDGIVQAHTFADENGSKNWYLSACNALAVHARSLERQLNELRQSLEMAESNLSELEKCSQQGLSEWAKRCQAQDVYIEVLNNDIRRLTDELRWSEQSCERVTSERNELREQVAAMRGDGWIPVSERLPEEFECVFLTFSTKYGYQTTMFKSRGWGGRGLWGTTDPYFSSHELGITHWMQLPAIPQPPRR